VVVQVVTGLGSGLVGSLVGAQAQRWQYKQKRREELWHYEQALQDEGDYLTYDVYHGGTERYRKPGAKSLGNARNLAYVAIQQLPAVLRDDLIKDDFTEFKTHFEIGDHLQGLTHRLREHLRATETRSAVIRRAARIPALRGRNAPS
jgi:hypothetical protein